MNTKDKRNTSKNGEKIRAGMRKEYILEEKVRNNLGYSPNQWKRSFSHSYSAAVGVIIEKAMARQGGYAEQARWEYV